MPESFWHTDNVRFASGFLACSVTTQEVVDAIEQQTGRAIDKRLVTLPEIKETGTFAATVKLHPEVIGEFKIVVQREKNKA